uniref:uncharacterized protein LOC114587991 n=1 Tax=Podarcis muralis TaxID=64176 RepID=UPI00109F9F92|nr:uncharacterized protein LOC114587991 [Podarcis muralis]
MAGRQAGGHLPTLAPHPPTQANPACASVNGRGPGSAAWAGARVSVPSARSLPPSVSPGEVAALSRLRASRGLESLSGEEKQQQEEETEEEEEEEEEEARRPCAEPEGVARLPSPHRRGSKAASGREWRRGAGPGVTGEKVSGTAALIKCRELLSSKIKMGDPLTHFPCHVVLRNTCQGNRSQRAFNPLASKQWAALCVKIKL